MYVVVRTTLCVGTGSRLGWKREVGWELRNGPWRLCIPHNRSNNNNNYYYYYYDMRDIQPGWHAERHVKGRGSLVESALHIDHGRANDGREGRGGGRGSGLSIVPTVRTARLGTQVGAGAGGPRSDLFALGLKTGGS